MILRLRQFCFGACCAVASVLLSAGVGFAAEGQPSTNHISRYDVRVWQTDEGLPQNSVNAIAQTSDGYLWVGTREGLARFDGLRFTVVEDVAVPYLRGAAINALYVTRDDSLWIASESNGLTRLKDGSFTQFLKPDGLPDNQIHSPPSRPSSRHWIW